MYVCVIEFFLIDDPELLAQLANLKGASKTATTKRSMPKLDVTR